MSDHRITIRLKPDEYALLSEKAGRQALGSFIRELALDKAVERRNAVKPVPIKDHKALAQILAMLGQHRLVRAFKAADQQVSDGVRAADDETKLLIRDCHALLDRSRKLLIHALGLAER
ncbi:hypothetical protein A9Q94_06480 [Rhodobacterales bacterium 56_14_T64]|nr:hypothetical protein A9Q94_06480 [Rhodobacterales bacterium 56_14_T64]